MLNSISKGASLCIKNLHSQTVNNTKPSISRIVKIIENTTVSSKNTNQFIRFFDQSFETYIQMKSIKPVADFLKLHKINNLKQQMNDHMAFRAPNEETGLKMIKELIESGLYQFKFQLNSNTLEKSKQAITKINIANGNQYGITLIATPLAKHNVLPNYIFISINLDCDDGSNLYQDMNKPFKLSNDLKLYSSPYWQPAQKLTLTHGAFFPNHYTLKVDHQFLDQLNCDSIFGLRELFLNQGFQENESLSIKECPDVTQFALQSMGDGVYLEYLERKHDRNGNQIPGFSSPHNVNRIGANAA